MADFKTDHCLEAGDEGARLAAVESVYRPQVEAYKRGADGDAGVGAAEAVTGGAVVDGGGGGVVGI